MPQLIIQIVYLTFVDSQDGLATLSLTCTALNILLQVISKLALSTSHVDGKVVLDGMRDKLDLIHLKKETGKVTEEQAEEETVQILPGRGQAQRPATGRNRSPICVNLRSRTPSLD